MSENAKWGWIGLGSGLVISALGPYLGVLATEIVLFVAGMIFFVVASKFGGFGKRGTNKRRQFQCCAVLATVVFMAIPVLVEYFKPKKPTSEQIARNIGVFERYANEWEGPHNAQIEISDGALLRNRFREKGRDPYRLSIQLAHFTPDVIIAAGTELFLTFAGKRALNIYLLPPEVKFWVQTHYLVESQQWHTTIPAEIKPSTRESIGIVGVNQSLFLRAPVPPGQYLVHYVIQGKTLAMEPVPFNRQGQFGIEIYCPAGDTKCL